MWHEKVGVSITGNSTNPTRFQHPVAGTYKKEMNEAGKKYFSVASGGGTGRTLHPDNMAAGPASYGMTDTMGRMHSDAQFAGSSSVPAHVEMMGLIGMGNNPMVGAHRRRGGRCRGSQQVIHPFSWGACAQAPLLLFSDEERRRRSADQNARPQSRKRKHPRGNRETEGDADRKGASCRGRCARRRPHRSSERRRLNRHCRNPERAGRQKYRSYRARSDHLPAHLDERGRVRDAKGLRLSGSCLKKPLAPSIRTARGAFVRFARSAQARSSAPNCS